MVLIFFSFSSKTQIILDVVARMAMRGALHKKIQLQKGHVLIASKSIIHTSGKQVRPVFEKLLPVSLSLITFYDNFVIIVILSAKEK